VHHTLVVAADDEANLRWIAWPLSRSGQCSWIDTRPMQRDTRLREEGGASFRRGDESERGLTGTLREQRNGAAWKPLFRVTSAGLAGPRSCGQPEAESSWPIR